MLAGVVASAGLGCAYTPKTIVTLRDPSAVSIDVDAGKGLRTILPPSATEGAVALPESAPPYQGILHQKTFVHRLAGGPIRVDCKECSPDVKTLLTMDGRIVLGEGFQAAKIDFAQKELRLRLSDLRDASDGTMSGYDADAVTPWTNVVDVRRVSTPDRDMGVKMLLSAAIGAVLGGLSLGEGVGGHHTSTTAFGAVVLPLSAILAAGGLWYVTTPPREEVLKP